jgi:hypothetical protein
MQIKLVIIKGKEMRVSIQNIKSKMPVWKTGRKNIELKI